MTIHLIEYDDVAYLGYNIGYLDQLPQRIETFKIKLDLVPAAEYGKYKEPVLDRTVAVAREGSPLWRTSATQIRTLHQAVKNTLTELIELMDSKPFDSRLRQVTSDLEAHAAAFKRQQTECERIIDCAKQVTPRFMDFMNVRAFEFARRKGLMTDGNRSGMPDTLSSALTDDDRLTSALSTVQWNQHAFNTAVLSAGNMGAYCSRLSGLMETTVQHIHALKADASPRRLRVASQSATSSAREAKRLIDYTFEHILRFSF